MFLSRFLRFMMFISLLLFFLSMQNGLAQTKTETKPDFPPSLGFSASYSPTSFRAWGTMQNTRQFYLNLQYVHSRIEFGAFRAEIAAELTLPGFIRYPIDGKSGLKKDISGMGITPLKIIFPFNSKPSHFFIMTSAGLLVTQNPFPVHEGARLNYRLKLGAGYRLNLTDHAYLHAGYNLSHFSNGNSASENPGIDSHMFFVSILFRYL